MNCTYWRMKLSDKTFKVYLAGPITGLTFGDAQDWRAYVQSKIDPRIKCYSPLRGKEYLAQRGALVGSYDEYPLSTASGITTRDRFDCMGSDLVIFNLLGAKQISVGTMIELGWADAARNPAILVMENPKAIGVDGWGHKVYAEGVKPNAHEHPMVTATTGFRVDNLDDAVKLAEIILLNKAPEGKQ